MKITHEAMIFSPTMILPFHLSLPLQFQISILIPGLPLLCVASAILIPGVHFDSRCPVFVRGFQFNSRCPFSFQVSAVWFAPSNLNPGFHSHSKCLPFHLRLTFWFQVSIFIPGVPHSVCCFHSDSRCPLLHWWHLNQLPVESPDGRLW